MSPAEPSPPEHGQAPRGPEFKVELSVDGQRLPLKAFLHDVIGGSISGLVDGLRDPSEGTHDLIEVRVIRRASQSSQDDAQDS